MTCREPEQRSLSARYWALPESRRLAGACLTHPLLLGLAGRLAPENDDALERCFRSYIAQDAFYLEEYEQTFAHLRKLCLQLGWNDLADEIETFRTGADGERASHLEYCDEMGLTEEERNDMLPATLDYVDLLRRLRQKNLADGESEKPAEHVVAQVLSGMAPCMRLYQWLGAELLPRASKARTKHHRRWLETYGGERFQAHDVKLHAVWDAVLRRAVDAAAPGTAEALLESLEEVYLEAMLLEYRFFDAQPALAELRAGLLAEEELGDVLGQLRTRDALHVPRVLAVAGSDSGGGAGIQADIKACMSAGAFCSTAVTAITAQNTEGVTDVLLLEPALVESQVRAVLDDLGTDVIKTGMLPSPEVASLVAAAMDDLPDARLVVDPVMVASSGDRLADDATVRAIKSELLPRATVATPNVPEALVLLGRDPGAHPDGLTPDEMVDAARDLAVKLGPRFVLLKGGHNRGVEDAVDVFFDSDNGRATLLRLPRCHEGSVMHGTGCTLASTLASLLARGFVPLHAAQLAKAAVHDLIQGSRPQETCGLLGSGVQRPLLY